MNGMPKSHIVLINYQSQGIQRRPRPPQAEYVGALGLRVLPSTQYQNKCNRGYYQRTSLFTVQLGSTMQVPAMLEMLKRYADVETFDSQSPYDCSRTSRACYCM